MILPPFAERSLRNQIFFLKVWLGTRNPHFVAWPLELGLGTPNPRFVVWPLELAFRDSQSTLCCVAP